MEKGTVLLAFERPAALDFAALAEACKSASHRLRAVRVDVPGRFDGSAFVVDGTGQRFAVEPPSAASGPVRLRAVVDRWDAPVLRVEP